MMIKYTSANLGPELEIALELLHINWQLASLLQALLGNDPSTYLALVIALLPEERNDDHLWNAPSSHQCL